MYNFEGRIEGVPRSLANEIAKDPVVARAVDKGAGVTLGDALPPALH
jgi:hypothetical protein